MQYNYDNEMNFVFANGLQSKTMTIFLQIMCLSRLAHKISNVEKYMLFDEHGKVFDTSSSLHKFGNCFSIGIDNSKLFRILSWNHFVIVIYLSIIFCKHYWNVAIFFASEQSVIKWNWIHVVYMVYTFKK